ncbi:hypothetical protein JTB14_019192 [Gonioctena quinquepunctata]|nr:hypothetical protein JTB14_019192 [Gonioctena quinquepunctata]
MVRTYKPKKTSRQAVDEESMKSAIQNVMQGVLSYRKAAVKYNLKLSTLESRVKKYKNSNDAEGSSNRTFDSKYTSFQVFSTEEEKLLNDYIIKCCKMHYGLTTIQARKLAYEYAKSLSLKYPAKWEENKMAGKEWMYGFRRRNPELSLRKPENTSAARSFGFNKTSVTEFYTNLKAVYERHPLTADRIFNFDESAFSDEDFAPTEVYTSGNLEHVPPTQNVVEDLSAPTPQPSVSDICQPSTSETQDFLEVRRESIHQIEAPLKTVLTPEVIRPYPTVVRSNKTNKGRRPGKSRIYTDTPEKKLIEEKHNEKQLKKLEQERRARARQMKRSLANFNSKTKNKKAKNTGSDESDCDGSDISFQESSTSITDEDETEQENFEMNRSQLTVDVIPENIEDGSFILVRFPKKKSIIYYVGKVVSHYSQTEFKVSYLRKKPGFSWTFVFPNVEDIHTVYITDVEMILPEPKPPTVCTSRTSKLFTFSVNFSNFTVQ